MIVIKIMLEDGNIGHKSKMACEFGILRSEKRYIVVKIMNI